MRTYLKWVLPALVVALVAYLGWGFTTKLHQKQETAERINTLPDFVAEGLDKLPVSQKTLENAAAVLIYFNPPCDHCQREADEIRTHITSLTNTQVLLLSSAPLAELSAFARVHQLNRLPRVRVAHIDPQVAYKTFGFTSVPDILIYHADGTLTKRFRGETSINAITRHL